VASGDDLAVFKFTNAGAGATTESSGGIFVSGSRWSYPLSHAIVVL
jgi:hypothetical protein